MRKVALETTDEQLSIDATDWFTTQRTNLEELARVERETADSVRRAASRKVAETRGAIRLGIGLAGGVVVISSLLGWAIARGMMRSVRVLSKAAVAVQTTGDFGIRADKTSSDELGVLTDAFNGMLAGIQERDRELQGHRENLTALVDARTRELSEKSEQMRLVLDSVEQGLAMIDRQGRLYSECSRVFAQWFGKPERGTPFAAALAGDDETMTLGLEQAYDQLIDDVLPIELALEQMPARLIRGERQFALSFQSVLHENQVDRTLVVVRDVTSELCARRAEAAQREKIKTFEHVMRDRFGFVEFVSEARDLATSLQKDDFPSSVERLRAVHTLKGISATFDLNSIAGVAHELEQALIDDDAELTALLTTKMISAWDDFCREIAPVLGNERDAAVHVTAPDLESVIALVRSRKEHGVIERALTRLRHEPASLRFRRIEEQLKALARRQGKPDPAILIDAGDVRIPVGPFREFWAAFAHVIRNTIDHGLEPEDDRVRRGKPRGGRIELKAKVDANTLTIEITDDGRGIDWSKLADKARERGLAHATHNDLVKAMFTDGVSAAARISEFSGRGVGMAVVRQACSSLRGEIAVVSEPGRGTKFCFVFPSLPDAESLVGSARPSALTG
jgi:two-component system chemotaxis sensor kinase CheA